MTKLIIGLLVVYCNAFSQNPRCNKKSDSPSQNIIIIPPKRFISTDQQIYHPNEPLRYHYPNVKSLNIDPPKRLRQTDKYYRKRR